MKQTYAPISFGQNSGIQSKGKKVVSFLCVFDGLRTPSIRRLIRKPQTICQKPLISFDPTYYSPESQKAFPYLYKRTFGSNCQSSIIVDPSVDDVTLLLRSEASTSGVRILIHYCGQGTHIPNKNGLFFFTEDKKKYKPYKMQNFLKLCVSSPCFIFDCPSAAVLKQFLTERKDAFAFFACDDGEELPYSTNTPMDLFSSCLLSPYDTAIWWHLQRHSPIFTEQKITGEKSNRFLSVFLSFILDAIGFETQTPEIYSTCANDSILETLFRGFLLAQRVMHSFNIHCSAYPEIKSANDHPFWGVWEIAIDFCLTLPLEKASTKLFNLCMNTFETCPSPGIFSIYSFFIKTEKFKEEASTRLLNYLDKSDISILNIASRSTLPKILFSINKPNDKCFLILAKLISSDYGSILKNRFQMTFLFSKEIDVFMSGMLVLCCCNCDIGSSSLSQLIQKCVPEYAPMSALVLGTLLLKGRNMLMSCNININKFSELLDNEHPDIRLSIVYLLGSSFDPFYIPKIIQMINDDSYLVRIQVIYALSNYLSSDKTHSEIISALEKLSNDDNSIVSETSKAILLNPEAEITNPIFNYLVQSVREKLFLSRFKNNNIFDSSLIFHS